MILFCLPYAGGSERIYYNWSRYLEPLIELVPIELARRGKRFSEGFYNDISEAVEDIYNKKKIEKHLKLLGMNEKVKIKDNEFSTVNLSTGQRKRLVLLMTYLEDRPVYLFDEWTADQDPEFRRFFYRELLPGLKERGKCVIAITHDDNYFDACNRAIKMDMGELVMH